ncbi:MAG: SDR family oxidoreductase [Ignavibacteria bacterium]
MSNTALITGASSGIGLELARKFASDNYDLVLVARRRDNLQKISEELANSFGVKIKIIVKDLSKDNSAREIFDETKSENITVNILINNAGFGSYGAFAGADPDTDNEMIRVNIASLVILTKLFLKEMLIRNSGRIMNVASIAAFQPGPNMALYYATKAFVLSFSEAVAEEISGSKVTITCLCPGPTKTGFQERAGTNKIKLADKKSAVIMSAQKVASIGYNGLMKGKRIIIPGKINWLVANSLRFAPRKLVTKVAKFVNSE